MWVWRPHLGSPAGVLCFYPLSSFCFLICTQSRAFLWQEKEEAHSILCGQLLLRLLPLTPALSRRTTVRIPAKILPKQKDLQLNTLNKEPVPPAMLSLGRQHGHLCCGSRIYLRHIHTENRKPLIPGVRVGFYISTLESRSL